ncbi:MAG TPA: hypothetical protein VNG90_00155, partial [Candidatus Acidoferrum sp.]|nr:hypothetical protein [Candidatus Acidoferrum sp.]
MKIGNNQNTQSSKAAVKSYKVGLIAAVVFILLYTLLANIPFSGPYFQYPLQIMRCGSLPLIGSDFAAGNTYVKPGDSTYGVDLWSDHFFCSVQEAQAQ